MKKIIYIGNNLNKGNPTSIVLLTKILKQKFIVKSFSNKHNIFVRLVDMIIGLLTNKNAKYVLIDTYSTLNFYYAIIISQLCRVLNIPYVTILRGGGLPVRLKSFPFLCDLIFKNSLENIALSGFMKVEFKKKNYKTKFIPNVIELKKYQFKARNQCQPKLLWVRAFQEIYNPIMALKVLEILKKNFPNAVLCMVGPDKDGSLEFVKNRALELGMLDSIEFTGFLNKEQWTKKAIAFDVFINTTTIDNTPVSVLEAMALGLPVVSTNVGGVPYLIKDGLNGVLVDDNNENEMVNAIINLIENPLKAQKIAKNARNLVEGFDTEIVKKKWFNLLN